MNEASADTAPSPAPATPSTAGAGPYNVDSSEFKPGPHQAFEYKYRTEKGAIMVYASKTTARVKYEFHGEPDDHTLRVQTYANSKATTRRAR